MLFQHIQGLWTEKLKETCSGKCSERGTVNVMSLEGWVGTKPCKGFTLHSKSNKKCIMSFKLRVQVIQHNQNAVSKCLLWLQC